MELILFIRLFVCLMCFQNNQAIPNETALEDGGVTIPFANYMKLFDEIAKAKNLAQNASDQQMILQQTVKDLQHELSVTKSKLSNLEGDLANESKYLQQDLSITKSKLSNLENETKDMSNRTAETSHEIKEDYNKLKVEYSKLQSQYGDLANESKYLQQDLSITKSKLSNLENETKDMSNRTAETSHEIKEDYNKLKVEYSKLQSQYGDLANESKYLQQDLSITKSKLSNLEKETKDMSNRTAETSHEIKEDYNKLKVEYSKLQSQYGDLANESKYLQQDLSITKSKLSNLENETKDMSNRTAETSHEIKEDYNKLKVEYSKLQSQYGDLANESKYLQQDLSITKSKLSNLEKETKDMSNRTAETSHEIKEDYNKLKVEYSKLQSQYGDLANESKYLQQDLSITKSKLSNLENETKDMSNRTAETSHEIKEDYNKLKVEYSKLQSQYGDLANESKYLQQDLSITKSKLSNLEKETKDMSNRSAETSHEIKEDYNKLKVEYSKLQSQYGDLANKTRDLTISFLPIWNKIASLEGDVMMIQNEDYGRCCNETARLEKELQDTNSKVTGLVSNSKTRNDDLISLHNKLINDEKSIISIQSIVQSLSLSLNISQNLFDNKLSQLTDELVQGLQYANRSNNETVRSLLRQIETLEMTSSVQESNFTSAMTMLSEEMVFNLSSVSQELKQEIESLGKTNNKSLENYKGRVDDQLTTMEVNLSRAINSSSADCQENAVLVNHRVDTLTERQNKSEQKFLNNLDILDANSKALESNLTAFIHELSSKCEQNISAIETDITKRLMAMQSHYNFSIEQIAKDIKHVKGESNFVRQSLNLAIHSISTKSSQNVQKISSIEKRLNAEAESLHNLQNSSRKHSEDIDELKKQADNLQLNQTETARNLLSTFNQRISGVKAKLDNEIQKLNDSQRGNNKNISALENELHARDKEVNDRLNTSITSLQHDIGDLRGETNVLKFNQSNLRTQITNDVAQNITGVEIRFKDAVTQLMERHNTSIESIANSVDMLQGRIDVFELDITRAMNNIFNNLDKNISQVETALKTMVQLLSELHKKSVQTIWMNLTDFQTLSTAQMVDLNLAIQNVSTESDHKITNIETDIKNELKLITNKHDKKIQDEINQLSLKLNSIAKNVTETLLKTDNKDKVALMACSSIAKFSGGSVIPFRNTRLRHGVSDTNSFNSTGKFVCERPGLYLISAQIMSYSKGAAFIISKNGQELTRVQVTPYHDSDSHNYHTGTGLAVAELKLNDKIWVEVPSIVTDMQIFGSESCLNIVKLK